MPGLFVYLTAEIQNSDKLSNVLLYQLSHSILPPNENFKSLNSSIFSLSIISLFYPPLSPVYQTQFITSITICLIFFLIKPTGTFPILLIQQLFFSTLDWVLLRGKNFTQPWFYSKYKVANLHKALKIALQSSCMFLIRSIIPILHMVLFNLLPFPQPFITFSIHLSRYCISQRKIEFSVMIVFHRMLLTN